MPSSEELAASVEGRRSLDHSVVDLARSEGSSTYGAPAWPTGPRQTCVGLAHWSLLDFCGAGPLGHHIQPQRSQPCCGRHFSYPVESLTFHI